MPHFFDRNADTQIVDSPNGALIWWHNMPLPDGRRINGEGKDKRREFKLWEEMGISPHGGLEGKRVLDIGANDGFFSLASIAAGASHVTSLENGWSTWPKNIRYASEQWGMSPEIVTGDFRSYQPAAPYDVVLFLGVLYHIEDVFNCMRTLRGLLVPGGHLYIETQMARAKSDLPIFESASDIYPTIAPQAKRYVGRTGFSNYLFPNVPAMLNLAHTFDFTCELMRGRYSEDHPHRAIFRLIKAPEEIFPPDKWSIATDQNATMLEA